MAKTKIRSLTSNGEGIGTLENGKSLFIEGALPGEEVTYQLLLEKKNYAVGRLESILLSSPAREFPPCPLFGECGGCQLQHLNYDEQLEIKRERIKEALRRIAKKEAHVCACKPSPMPYHYRNKIQLPQADGQLGLFRKKSHEIIPVKHCLIHCSHGEEIYDWIRKKIPPSVTTLLIRSAIFTDETLVALASQENQSLHRLAQELVDHFPLVKGVVYNRRREEERRPLGFDFEVLAGLPYITEKIGDLLFRIRAETFFQVNSWQAEPLFREATKKIEPEDCVIDAFCGVGTLALFAAQKAKSVQGYEIVSQSIEMARENAQLNRIENVRFTVKAAEKGRLRCDHLLLNPPRKGLDPSIFDKIEAKKIVYISCNPATLARDLALLTSYDIEEVQPFDLFPQTMHVETVVHLCRKSD